MDASFLCGTSDSEGKSSESTCHSITSLGDHNSVDKLSTGLSSNLKIDEGIEPKNTDYVQRIYVEGCHIEEEDEEEEDDFSEEELLLQMGYAKSQPKRDIIKGAQRQYHDGEEEEEEEDLSEESLLTQMGYLKNEPPKHEPFTTPTADLNLVSAFKGSREKEGKPAKECRVSWAPDVYDPPPTSAEHFAQSNTERHKSEQKVKGAAGKNRQKSGGKGTGTSKGGGGGGSKGSVGGGKATGKDKKEIVNKQAKKHSGSASNYSDCGDY